jgi:SAM-dependent methyltransferase
MSAGTSLYRSQLLDAITGGCLRPGGLALTDRALAHCALPRGARVVDIGCGLGTTVAHLRDRLSLDAVGIDRDAALVRRAAVRHRGAPLVCASGTALPVRDGAAAAVLVECTLSSAADPAPLLDECRRILAPGGMLAVTDLYARDESGLASARAVAAPPPDSPQVPRCAAFLAGLTTVAGLTAAVVRAGFALRAVEDHSTQLAGLMGRLLMEHGSLAPFWELVCACGGDPDQTERALARARPGYLLLLAERVERDGEDNHER